jgi:sulfur-oxidizing protein SoxA
MLESNTPAPGTAAILAEGKRLWTRKFANGRSLAQCFPNGGRRVASAYPQVDAKLKRIVTLETAVNQCLRTHGEPLLDAADPATMGAILAYVRSLADGQKIAVRVSGTLAEDRFERGRRLYFTRMGQQNYACASCHVLNAGRFYGEAALPAAPGSAARWPFVREGRAVTLQAQVRECLERMGAAPFPAGSDELAQVEYFLTALSQGLVIKPNAWRPR